MFNPETTVYTATFTNPWLKWMRKLDVLAVLLLVLVVNRGMLLGLGPAQGLIFYPGPVLSGQVWRLFSYMLVHVSPYHLLLDSVAFIFLLAELDASLRRRLVYVAVSALGGVLAAMCWSDEVWAIGLCGLSGPAHGLLAIWALEFMHRRRMRLVGIGLFVGLVLKIAGEAVADAGLFEALHWGYVGTPLPHGHAGGVLAVLLAWLWLTWSKQRTHDK